MAPEVQVRPRLLLIDEPTSALDREVARVFLEAVKEVVEQGTTVLMSSHRADELDGLCNQRIMLQQGRIENIEHRATLTLKSAHADVVDQPTRDDEATRVVTGRPGA